MPFKSDKQRKGFFANLNRGSRAMNLQAAKNNPDRPKSEDITISVKKSVPKEFKKLKDSDKDNVPDLFDSKKFDPKKQSFLHDFQLKRLRKQEAKLEEIKEKELKKLKNVQETLREKQLISARKSNNQQIQLQRKQAVINEIIREKDRLKEIKDANLEAKRQLNKLTVTGKTKAALIKGGKATLRTSLNVIDSTNAFFKSDSTKRTIKNISKAIKNLP